MVHWIQIDSCAEGKQDKSDAWRVIRDGRRSAPGLKAPLKSQICDRRSGTRAPPALSSPPVGSRPSPIRPSAVESFGCGSAALCCGPKCPPRLPLRLCAKRPIHPCHPRHPWLTPRLFSVPFVSFVRFVGHSGFRLLSCRHGALEFARIYTNCSVSAIVCGSAAPSRLCVEFGLVRGFKVKLNDHMAIT